MAAVSGTAEDQRQWIERYKSLEAAGETFYYIVERLDGVPCGTHRIYDITPNSCKTGSWMLDANKPSKAALECYCLCYEIAFDRLGVSKAMLDVMRGNENTIAFHRRFGLTETHSDEVNLYFSYSRAEFEKARARYMAILTGASE